MKEQYFFRLYYSQTSYNQHLKKRFTCFEYTVYNCIIILFQPSVHFPEHPLNLEQWSAFLACLLQQSLHHVLHHILEMCFCIFHQPLLIMDPFWSTHSRCVMQQLCTTSRSNTFQHSHHGDEKTFVAKQFLN